MALQKMPVVTAVFRYNHIAHTYMPSDPSREFDLRHLSYLLIDGFEDGSTLNTFVHDGVFGELDHLLEPLSDVIVLRHVF